MAMQIDKGPTRRFIKAGEKRVVKKLHKRQKRRELKRVDELPPRYNRYTDGWCM